MSGHRLEVYDSRGRALHPDSKDSDSRMQSYFDDQAFAMAVTDDGPTIEAYLRVKTEDQREQVSLRFIGDDPETVFADCRTAIETELVTGRGWEIMEPYGTGPEELFWTAIWEHDSSETLDTGPIDLFENPEYGLGLDPSDAQLLQTFPLEPGEPPAHLKTSNYAAIANALELFHGTEYAVTVSRPRRSPPDHGEIHFSPSQNQPTEFELHRDTESALEEQKAQQEQEQREEVFTSLGEDLSTLRQLGAKRKRVHTELAAALDETYPGLTVIPGSKLQELEQRALENSKTQQTTTDDRDRLGSESSHQSFLPGLAKSKKALAVLLLPVIVAGLVAGVLLFTSVGIPFVADDESPDPTSADFVVEINESTKELPQGEQFNVSVRVSNNGEETDEQPIELVIENESVNQITLSLEPDATESVVLSEQLDGYEPGQYEFRVESRDTEVIGEFTVSES